jgi:uncharacterized protein YaaR (DUF327 family)
MQRHWMRRDRQSMGNRQCKWCGNECRKRDAIWCSNQCRYSNARLRVWMRNTQRRIKNFVRPKDKTDWQGWCFYTATQLHVHKPKTTAQQWVERLQTMTSINRHRVTKQLRRSQCIHTIGNLKTWKQVIKTFVTQGRKLSHGLTLKDRWIANVHSVVNRMKGQMSHQEFIDWCRLIARWNS